MNIDVNELHIVIMNRFNLSVYEAQNLIQKLKDMVKGGENPEYVLFKLGIEPDYSFYLNK